MKLLDIVSDKEKRQFLPLAEHKLKSPLTAAKWSIETLVADKSLTPDQKELLQDIYFTVNKTITSLTDFFIIEAIREGKFTTIKSETDLTNLLEESVKTYDQVEIETKVDEKILANIDPNVFKIVLDNLITNSIKYTNKNNPTIEIELNSINDNIELIIIDDGIGIPEDEVSRIFELFYRCSNTSNLKESGSGLGLSIVKSIVEGWGGVVEYKNTGRTQFTISFPKNTNSDFKLIKS